MPSLPNVTTHNVTCGIYVSVYTIGYFMCDRLLAMCVLPAAYIYMVILNLLINLILVLVFAKLKSNQRTEISKYDIETCIDDNLMPIRMFKYFIQAQSLHI